MERKMLVTNSQWKN